MHITASQPLARIPAYREDVEVKWWRLAAVLHCRFCLDRCFLAGLNAKNDRGDMRRCAQRHTHTHTQTYTHTHTHTHTHA